MREILTLLGWHAAALITFVVSLAATLLATTWVARGAWWPSVIFQLFQRPAIARRLLLRTLLLAIVPMTLLFGVAGLAAAILGWAIFAPRWIAEQASAISWADDAAHPDVRERALAVRNRRRELLGESPLDGTSTWPQYIIDVAKGERQRRYQEQFDRNGLDPTALPSPPQS
jgi:hypothetical protein